MSTVVIGANFGDEGKGLITDFETRRLGAKVVARFNGGAQAGHTVVDGDKRYVFGHLSSGTFTGATTYLSSDFIVNPLALEKEIDDMRKMGVVPDIVAAHEHARVSTIYDMLMNGILETSRGDKRHGSCGMGINETVTRHAMGPTLSIRDLTSRHFDLGAFFKEVAEVWVPFRLQQLGLGMAHINDTCRQILREDPRAHAKVLKNCVVNIAPVFENYPILSGQPVVFEGAQGLALDEELGTYPHVTRSRTGLVGAIKAAEEMQCQELNPVYVTRVYLTRHGAGELAHEGEKICDHDLVDRTNVLNQWQGNFRYAPLNLPQLKRFIELDYARAKLRKTCVRIGKPNLAVTCLDQVGDKVRMIAMNGVTVEIPTSSAAEYIAHAIDVNLSHTSRGPSAGDVTFHIINS